jgi:tRNA A37 threonylcarbamoyladenosine modification protein TsaB
VPVVRVAERAIAPAAMLAELADTAPQQLVGDGVLRYPALRALGPLIDDDGAPHPRELLRLGRAALLRGETSSLESAAPNYIRRSEAEIMKDKR